MTTIRNTTPGEIRVATSAGVFSFNPKAEVELADDRAELVQRSGRMYFKEGDLEVVGEGAIEEEDEHPPAEDGEEHPVATRRKRRG